MAALATVEDVLVRMGRQVSADEEARIAALLDDASSVVRQITGRAFGSAQYILRRRVRDGRIVIGARDVTAVDSIALVDGTEVDATWDGLQGLTIGALNIFDGDASADVVDVTITCDSDPAPQWVVAIVAQTAARAFGRPADQTGITQESIAGYSYQLGAAAASGAVGLLPADEARLRKAYPPLPATAWLALR